VTSLSVEPPPPTVLPQDGILWNCFWSSFRMPVEKVPQLPKSDKHNRYFTFKSCNLIINFPSIILNKKFYRQFCRSVQNTHLMSSNVFLKVVHVMRWCGKFCRTGQSTDCSIHVMGGLGFMCWIIIVQTETENTKCLVQFYGRVINRTVVSRFAYLICLLAFGLLLVHFVALRLILRYLKKCLTSVIMWCVEEYRDTQQ
jgi:hypothetical protein